MHKLRLKLESFAPLQGELEIVDLNQLHAFENVFQIMDSNYINVVENDTQMAEHHKRKLFLILAEAHKFFYTSCAKVILSEFVKKSCRFDRDSYVKLNKSERKRIRKGLCGKESGFYKECKIYIDHKTDFYEISSVDLFLYRKMIVPRLERLVVVDADLNLVMKIILEAVSTIYFQLTCKIIHSNQIFPLARCSPIRNHEILAKYGYEFAYLPKLYLAQLPDTLFGTSLNIIVATPTNDNKNEKKFVHRRLHKIPCDENADQDADFSYNVNPKENVKLRLMKLQDAVHYAPNEEPLEDQAELNRVGALDFLLDYFEAKPRFQEFELKLDGLIYSQFNNLENQWPYAFTLNDIEFRLLMVVDSKMLSQNPLVDLTLYTATHYLTILRQNSNLKSAEIVVANIVQMPEFDYGDLFTLYSNAKPTKPTAELWADPGNAWFTTYFKPNSFYQEWHMPPASYKKPYRMGDDVEDYMDMLKVDDYLDQSCGDVDDRPFTLRFLQYKK
ncbi:unnamed protein product [Bursaphelenchus okinawaensis]|uniref:Uncharacterized protein n=1 Tax=Bursaphelenchus okinawaensis TaxID=465554 RepID=A0A811L8H0_9BILA|nr:unnamed protein product [Bursaphelenchus okinawaensis]CAG9117877.1 unnamed protein product [Bursaphelenchus okinawaensis]